jgi:hypothetical protein
LETAEVIQLIEVLVASSKLLIFAIYQDFVENNSSNSHEVKGDVSYKSVMLGNGIHLLDRCHSCLCTLASAKVEGLMGGVSIRARFVLNLLSLLL